MNCTVGITPSGSQSIYLNVVELGLMSCYEHGTMSSGLHFYIFYFILFFIHLHVVELGPDMLLRKHGEASL